MASGRQKHFATHPNSFFSLVLVFRAANDLEPSYLGELLIFHQPGVLQPKTRSTFHGPDANSGVTVG